MQDEKGMRPFFGKGAGSKQNSRRLPWLRYAAVFLLLATFAGWLGLRVFPPEHPVLRRIASAFGIEYADPFATDPLVETLVGAIFREDDFQLLAPAPMDTLVPGDVLHLQYTGYHPNALQFKLMNNQGMGVGEFEVRGGAAMLRLPETPGLYYWRLSDGSELLFLGRLILRESDETKN
jgi:hypothetical protein